MSKTKTIAQAGFALGQERAARLAAERENAQLRTQLQQQQAASPAPSPPTPEQQPKSPEPKPLAEMSRAEVVQAAGGGKRGALAAALGLHARGVVIHGKH